jgi:hypothetical protein
VSGSSLKQPIDSRSSIEAEYKSIANGTTEVRTKGFSVTGTDVVV